jgi:hypothetical protein
MPKQIVWLIYSRNPACHLHERTINLIGWNAVTERLVRRQRSRTFPSQQDVLVWYDSFIDPKTFDIDREEID